MKKDTLSQIIIIFRVLLAAMLVMFVAALLIVKNTGPLVEWTISERENLKSLILILSLGGIPASYFFHSQRVKHMSPSSPLKKKLIQFRNSFFVKIATMEALAILGLFGYMLTADTTFLYVFGLLFIAYLVARPTTHNILSELEPEESEKPNENE